MISMMYQKKELSHLRDTPIFIKTIDNKYYAGILKNVEGLLIEIRKRNDSSEYIYKSAICRISDSRTDIECPDGNHWIT
jgi:hypothetical protein